MRLVGALAVSLMAIGLTACGSSHQRSYSVAQVESAFADHGIVLRPSQRRTTGNVVALVGRGGLRVLVHLSAQSWSVGWTGEKPVERGNLLVFRTPASEQAVDGALHDLR